jgi:predicted nucleic acid-binding protein
MTYLPDTSFLWALYRTQGNSSQADAFMAGLTGPLPVTSLVLLEFRQSVRFQVWLHTNQKTKGFSKDEGRAMLRDFQSDFVRGLFQVVPVDWPDVHRLAEELSAKYTEAEGHRFADILHVSTALHLGMTGFLTFDAGQKLLAQAEGLQVPA